MKSLLSLTLTVAMLSFNLAGQTPVPTNAVPASPPPTFFKGGMQIRYNSRVKSGVVGVADEYTFGINISNSASFNGNIKHLPYIAGKVYGVAQNSTLTYDLTIDAFHPKNPAIKVNVGRLYGVVPITPEGLYNFQNGTLQMGINAVGSAPSFQSSFGGTVQGKPLIKRSKGWFDTISDTLTIKRNVNGQNVAISVKKYDKMSFQSHKLAQGPALSYPEATVNGVMIYDYSRYIWYFDNVTVTYFLNGRQYADRLTGNILWQESPTRKTDGKGSYIFDIRVNEPPPNEAATFAEAADESAFFAVNSNVPSLSGTMDYKDTMQGETVTFSNVDINVMGNKLTKQSVMNVFKLVFFTCIVPVNAE
jgi:hypothetical protein